MPDNYWLKVAVPDYIGNAKHHERLRAYILQRSDDYYHTFGDGHRDFLDNYGSTDWIDGSGVYHVTFDLDDGIVRNVQATIIWELYTVNRMTSKPKSIVDDTKGINEAMKRLGLK